jgi:hypothetical protein
MMFKEAKALSRNRLSNPHQNISLHERLKKKKSIDLRDNSIIIDLGNNYDKISPINQNKLFK